MIRGFRELGLGVKEKEKESANEKKVERYAKGEDSLNNFGSILCVKKFKRRKLIRRR